MEDYTISFEFEVVEGYNVYNAKELGYMDNRTNGAEADAWNAFKEANNLASDYFPTNLIFHKNIDITVNDVPGYFFYTAEELNKSDEYAPTKQQIKESSTWFNERFYEYVYEKPWRWSNI